MTDSKLGELPFGERPGSIGAAPPGPQSRRLALDLREVESRNVTFVGDDAPVFLSAGAGANLADVDGNTYVDLGAAFGAAVCGHSNPAVVDAVAAQARRLLHGMGDVHPTPAKVDLARTLCTVTPGKGPKRVILASTGAEAVECALKTAAVSTGKPGVLCFSGAYHGLSYGALALTDRAHFRERFEPQLGNFAVRAPYPYCYRCPAGNACPPCNLDCLSLVEQRLRSTHSVALGAAIVEPVLGRGGEVPAPDPWLRGLRALCSEYGLLLIVDEVYTGFGRTGRWFACEHAGVVPDLLCVGKGLASGFPISACVGSAHVMDGWPASTGEAIHTSTFLGNPTGCAAALACIKQLQERRLVERAAHLEPRLHAMLAALRARSAGRIGDVRGRGLLWGLECVNPDKSPAPQLARAIVARALRGGVIVLAGGMNGNVVSLSPPLVITESQLEFAIDVLSTASSQDI